MNKFSALLCLLLFTGNVFGQNNKEAIKRYNENTLRQGQSFWGGEFYYKMDTPGIQYKLSSFGASPELLALLNQSPAAKKELTFYKKKLTTGSILYWSGFALLMTNVVLLTSNPYYYLNPGGYGSTTGPLTILGLMTGGLVLNFGGMALMIEAKNMLSKAVWKYNRDVIGGTISDQTKMNRELSLKFAVHF